MTRPLGVDLGRRADSKGPATSEGAVAGGAMVDSALPDTVSRGCGHSRKN